MSIWTKIGEITLSSVMRKLMDQGWPYIAAGAPVMLSALLSWYEGIVNEIQGMPSGLVFTWEILTFNSLIIVSFLIFRSYVWIYERREKVKMKTARSLLSFLGRIEVINSSIWKNGATNEDLSEINLIMEDAEKFFENSKIKSEEAINFQRSGALRCNQTSEAANFCLSKIAKLNLIIQRFSQTKGRLW